jgi:hypothetical protein
MGGKKYAGKPMSCAHSKHSKTRGRDFFFERVKQWERVPLQFFIDWENLQSVQIYSVKKVKVAKRKKFMLQCVANLQIDHGISSLF